jgi:hypothetical protein
MLLKSPSATPDANRCKFSAAALAVGFAAAACSICGCPAGASSGKPLTLVVSGDTAGWIVPCGCTSNQSGGLLRRGTYLAELRQKHDVLLVDAGGAAGGHSEYDRAKFEAILAGEREMGTVAHNLGAAEVQLGSEYLRRAQGSGIPFVSCNVRDREGALLVAPYIIHSLAGQRIALIGVLSPHLKAGQRSSLKIDSPREAILLTLEELRGKYDRVVVLSYVPEDELLELANNLPEVDAIVGGPTGQSITPKLVGPTLVAAATNKGKFLAQITIPPLGSKSSWSGEIVELNDRFADHAPQQANLKQFYTKLAESDFAPTQTSFAPSLPADPPAGFQTAGSAACRECHAREHEKWQASGHAHAWDSLTKTDAQVDADCQRCHTTNYGFPGGFVSARHSLERVSVGCESCHGPSLAHVQQPATHTAYFGQAAQQCTHCHDRENSPQFAFADYWSRIAHGKLPTTEAAQP